MINCTYYFTSDVMYKKVYPPPDLLARICKVNLSNAQIKNRPDLFSKNLFSRAYLL